jgi:hypothetical protein
MFIFICFATGFALGWMTNDEFKGEKHDQV